MNVNTECTTCEACEDTLGGLNSKLISIADKSLYNTRYGMNSEVDYALFKLLVFYKEVLESICDDDNCDCYYTVPEECPVVTPEPSPCYTCNCNPCSCADSCYNPGIQPAKVNTCICGCCPPLNPVCNQEPFINQKSKMYSTKALTKENIIERIKILTA